MLLLLPLALHAGAAAAAAAAAGHESHLQGDMCVVNHTLARDAGGQGSKRQTQARHPRTLAGLTPRHTLRHPHAALQVRTAAVDPEEADFDVLYVVDPRRAWYGGTPPRAAQLCCLSSAACPLALACWLGSYPSRQWAASQACGGRRPGAVQARHQRCRHAATAGERCPHAAPALNARPRPNPRILLPGGDEGYELYEQRLRAACAPYPHVIFIGDSMGATGACMRRRLVANAPARGALERCAMCLSGVLWPGPLQVRTSHFLPCRAGRCLGWRLSHPPPPPPPPPLPPTVSRRRGAAVCPPGHRGACMDAAG